ncbi:MULTISPECIES: GLPGLI family protein [Flavobacterium]|uniref:GLPGLI family protein n=1 Tax=Flavobacterium jumunjinense TaxID=998845 RepID=A0ABV5GQA3_9FLAO|nr:MULTISPECIES: GLPGLI family protein [Flavobacterium]
MKKIIILLCFITFGAFSQSQSGTINYTFIAKGTTLKSTLLFNKNESIYAVLINKKGKGVDVKADEENSNEEEGDLKLKIEINPHVNMPDALGLLTDLNNNIIIDHKYFTKGISGKEYDTLFVKDKAKNIAWELHEETKKINAFTCQKAIGQFRGRTYTVWFTYEIPVSAGPWKLNGLPGLILEASESKKQFYFFADKIALSTNENTIEKEKFLHQNYSTPIEEREKMIASMESIGEEITAKMKSALPRGVTSTSTRKANDKIIADKDQLEINFDDISTKK